MIKNVPYTTYATAPDDYQCPDGQLSASLNLINEDGALHPIPRPVTLHSGFAPDERVFIHQLPDGSRNYIIYTAAGVLFWLADKAGAYRTPIGPVSNLIGISVIGNTLAASTSSSLKFIIWRDNYYHILDEHPRIPQIEFGLRSQTIRNATIYADIPGISSDSWSGLTDRPYFALSDENSDHKTINEAIMAAILKDAAQAADANLFLTPFFVRYALRLMDGSLYWHSAPVLMIPNLTYPYIGIGTGARNGDRLRLDPRHKKCSLDLRILPYSGLGEWKNIIRSVDIFISMGLATYDQSKGLMHVGSINNNLAAFSFSDKSLRTGISRIASTTNNPAPDTYLPHWEDTAQTGRFLTFHSSEHSISQQIASTFTFYKFASIPADSLQSISGTTFQELKSEWLVAPSLDNLATREVMSDDFASHRYLAPQNTFVYNNRLSIANIKVTPPEPFPLRTSVTAVTDLGDTGLVKYSLRVWLRKNGSIVSRALATSSYPGAWSGYDFGVDITDPYKFPFFIFYPDPDAFKIEICCNNKYLTIPLTSHDFLNGAYWSRFENSTSDAVAFKTTSSETDAASSYNLPSSIYTSEVNNPFVFNPASVTSVGSGAVLALSSAAKALSQGQFGQFPLYAFTDQGVWALEVSATGTYSARQPITRDVCISPESVTQIDSAVLFATDRGIMLLSGSQTQCISETIDSPFPFDLSSLPSLDGIQEHYLLRSPLSIAPFRDFISGASMLYDYPHQRIIVFNPSSDYAYVYSLKSKTWGMIHSKLLRPVNSYPEALALTTDGDLVSLSSPASYTANQDTPFCRQLLVTRPLTLDAPDTLKTVTTVLQRGFFNPEHVKSILYGSRDLVSWHLVRSSTNHRLSGFAGTPYKYFRIALICNLSPSENIVAASVQFRPRLTNKLR